MIFKTYYWLKSKLLYSFHYRIRKGTCKLERELKENNQTRWLDLGSSVNHSNENFYFADLYPMEECLEEMKAKYFQLNITVPISNEDLDRLGKFDFIRMQHVFEHFTFEEADIVLDNCFKLLNQNGKLLISVPDLDIYVSRYLNKTLKQIPSFGTWAHKRIKENSPQSDYFSIFTHSMLYEKHLWCYNRQGLTSKLTSTGKFKDVRRIGLFNRLSGIPFTHNRLEEDLCVLATKL